jgi:invasion protein IalB
MRAKLTIAALMLTAFGVFVSPVSVRPAYAEGGGLPVPEGPSGQAVEVDLTPPSKKKSGSTLSSVLDQLVSAHVSSAAFAPGAGQFASAKVVITIRIDDSPGVANGVASQIEALGGRVANLGPDFIEAEVAVDRLSTIAAMDGVVRVDAIARPAAAVVTQGAAVHRSDLWNTHGLTGAGVKVGVIDVSFDGYASLMGSELPGTVTARCFTTVGVFTSNVTDCVNGDVHGTAVAETIYDIAPDAVFYISDPATPGDLQTAVAWMISQGVDVINHSVGWSWDGPGDGTSPFSDSPLATVNTAVAAGVLWVNAAGNEARYTWYAGYLDSDADGFVEFLTNGLELNTVSLSAGVTYFIQLRWGDAWGTATRDLDLALYNDSLLLVAASVEVQLGGPNAYPYEAIVFTPSSSGDYHLAIKHFNHLGGNDPTWLQLHAFSGPDLLVHTADTNGGSISNPAESANPGMLTVGAANWQTTAAIESFSSRGPTPDGRVKPDIVGADRGDTASYGPSGFPGTSQASPHVAGLAALVLQRFPAFTPQQTADYLKNNAVPTGSPDPNNVWGHGFARLADLSPLSPLNVSATAGDEQATVSWDAPTSDGGTAITGYTVVSNPDGVQVNVAGIVTQAIVGGLTNGTQYAFTVTASNVEGSGLISGPSAQVTPIGPPGPPTGVSATPGDGQASVSWDAPTSNGGSAITGYTVVSSPEGVQVNVAGTVTDAVVTGLANGTAYTFTVTATNPEGTGPQSGPPTGVSAVPGDGEATVSWDAPSSDGGASIQSYTVTSTPDGFTTVVGGSATDAVVSGLTNGVAYAFTVTASNSVGNGPQSGPSAQVTPVGLPGPPTGVSATPGDGQATVSWDAPTSDGGTAITGYTVVSSPEGAQVNVAPSASQAVVSGLTNGVAYTFTVIASNSVGFSPESGPSAQITPFGPPDAPTGVSASPNNGEATVSWQPPADNGGAAIQAYTVTSTPGGFTAVVGGSATDAVVSGLTNGVS